MHRSNVGENQMTIDKDSSQKFIPYAVVYDAGSIDFPMAENLTIEQAQEAQKVLCSAVDKIPKIRLQSEVRNLLTIEREFIVGWDVTF